MLTVSEVASRVGVSEQAVRKALKEGRLSGVRGERGWVVDVTAADTWAKGRGVRLSPKSPVRPNPAPAADRVAGRYTQQGPWRGSRLASNGLSQGNAQSIISQLVDVQRQLLNIVEQMAEDSAAAPSWSPAGDGEATTSVEPASTRWSATA